MPRRFSNVPDHLREPHEVEIQGFWNIYFVAIGIVILFGLVSGTSVYRLAAAERPLRPVRD